MATAYFTDDDLAATLSSSPCSSPSGSSTTTNKKVAFSPIASLIDCPAQDEKDLVLVNSYKKDCANSKRCWAFKSYSLPTPTVSLPSLTGLSPRTLDPHKLALEEEIAQLQYGFMPQSPAERGRIKIALPKYSRKGSRSASATRSQCSILKSAGSASPSPRRNTVGLPSLERVTSHPHCDEEQVRSIPTATCCDKCYLSTEFGTTPEWQEQWTKKGMKRRQEDLKLVQDRQTEAQSSGARPVGAAQSDVADKVKMVDESECAHSHPHSSTPTLNHAPPPTLEAERKDMGLGMQFLALNEVTPSCEMPSFSASSPTATSSSPPPSSSTPLPVLPEVESPDTSPTPSKSSPSDAATSSPSPPSRPSLATLTGRNSKTSSGGGSSAHRERRKSSSFSWTTNIASSLTSSGLGMGV